MRAAALQTAVHGRLPRHHVAIRLVPKVHDGLDGPDSDLAVLAVVVNLPALVHESQAPRLAAPPHPNPHARTHARTRRRNAPDTPESEAWTHAD